MKRNYSTEAGVAATKTVTAQLSLRAQAGIHGDVPSSPEAAVMAITLQQNRYHISFLARLSF